MKDMVFEPKGEYVVDTSVVYSSIAGYPEINSHMTPSELLAVRDICFEIISSLEPCFIAIDDENIIFKEYSEEVFDIYPNEYPTEWFNRMVASNRIRFMQVSPVNPEEISILKRRFRMPRPDCQFVFTASRTNKKILLHRDRHYENASGHIHKVYKVQQIHVLK